MLCLHEAKHFCAEIVTPIRPAQAAARDRAEAQMYPFDIRRPHEYLAIGTWRGQGVCFATGDLHRDVAIGPTSVIPEIEVRALRRVHQREQSPQRAVGIQCCNRFELLLDLCNNGRCVLAPLIDIAFGLRVELDGEQVQQVVGDIRVLGERTHLYWFRRIKSRLAAIARQSAKQCS